MAGSDYKQVLFCCNLSDIDSLENHCGKHIPFAITDNLSIKIVKDFVMTIGGINISTGDMDFVIEDTFVYVDYSCLFWINKDKFGFGGILYANDRFVDRFDFDGLKYKIFNLVRKYFNEKYNDVIEDKLNDEEFYLKHSRGDFLEKNLSSVKDNQNFNSKKNMAMHELVFTAINKAFKMI